MSQEIAPENLACFCHGLSLLKCPTLNPPEEPMAASGAVELPHQPQGEPSMVKKPTKGAQVHRRQFEKEVRIAVEDPEKREEVLQSMLHHKRDHDELILEAKDTQAKYRVRIKDLKKVLDGEALDLEQGLPSMRLVEETRNFSNNMITIKDVETKVTYESRQMTEEDNQVPISDLPNAEEDVEDARD